MAGTFSSRPGQAKSAPVLREFLNFLDRDMEKNPQHLQAISTDLVSHIRSLISDIDIDLDAPLLNEDE